jgi:SpoVK/Ycf46/Vps4 family AAA+-type ATPase
LTSGNIRRAAKLANASASLAGRTQITVDDVRQASRALNRQTLDSLATPVVSSGDWSSLAVKTQTLNELRNLEIRCSQRERLQGSVGSMLGQMNHGVRALFSGPSGTGKTLAARVLSSVLQKDLYRLDLSTVVNKYIGETEKNLSRLLARAEELDVILLLDEGDALLTKRTEVNTANDRYANLETNYLLQRLETFEGILIVTTNAGDRIDRAFARRMDIVINFPTPDVQERWNIWQLHLPELHSVQYSLLEEVAQRCEMTGGQIRNAILHASLMALNNGGMMNSAHLESAVKREYQKSGAVCPLRHYQSSAVTASRW